MNPIILYDNRFLDGALTATDTADGFHVNNIKDRNADTFWKAASYGTKYITRAPFAKGTLVQAEMRLSQTDQVSGWNFTAGWGCYTGSITGAKTFSTTGAGGAYINGANVQLPGKRYRVVIEGTSTTNGGLYFGGPIGRQYVAWPSGSFAIDGVYEVNLSGDIQRYYFRNAGAGNTEITRFEIYQSECECAGVYLPASLDLTPYLGDRIVCLDSALKKHIGYIKSIGTKAVNMTAAGSGSTGITIADNDNLDLGTHSLTIRVKTAQLAPAPGSELYLFYKYVGTPTFLGIALAISTTGKLKFYIGTGAASAAYESTVATGLLDGTEHDIVVVYTKESASTAGSVVFYIDGAQLGTSVAVPAGTPVTVSNTATLYINGTSTTRQSSTTRDATLYNRPLSAAEVLSLYNNNGIAAADQYGSQTSLVTGDNSTFASDTGWWSKSTGVSISGGACHFVNVADNAGLFRNTQLVAAGRWVKVTYTISNLTEGGIRVAIYGPTYGPTHTANGTYTDYILATGDSLGKVYIVAVGETSCDIDDVTITQAGACLDLNESGIDGIASLNSASMINSPALPYTTFSGASATGFHAESDGSGPHVAGTTDAIPFVSGRKYRVQFTLTLHSGTAPYYGAAVSLAGAVIGGASASNLATEGLNTYEFTCTGSDTGVIEFWNNSAPANYDISDFSVEYFGWKDSSTNGLDAAFPASGCAVVLFNNIVSTPDGSIYNWESIEGGFNYNDASGYAYKISEADACDGLFLFGHNLGTAGAPVSVESTDDEVNWTERLAAFTPSDDRAIMKLLTSFRAASKRLKIVSPSVAPYIAEAILGNRLEMPYPPDAPMTPYEEGIESEMTLSRGGRPLGVVTSYFPIDIQHRFSNLLRAWATDNFVPFWEYAKYFYPFAYAPDLDTWPDDVFFCTVSPDMKFRTPVSVLLYVDYIDLIMRGYRA